MKEKVRMNISREMHEWFMTIDGNNNDERMKRVIEVNDGYKELLESYTERGQAIVSMMQTSHRYQELYYKSRNNNRILKGLLGLSMIAAIISVSYLAYVQGWLL